MAAITICSDFGAPSKQCLTLFPQFPIYLPWRDGTEAIIFVFWMLSLKPKFSLSSFTFIKRRFNFSSLSARRVLSFAYHHVIDSSPGNLDSSLCFFQPSLSHDVLSILVIQAWGQYRALTYSFPYLEPVCCSMSSSNFASWPEYRFLKRQVRWSGIPISFRIFHSLLWSTQSKALA